MFTRFLFFATFLAGTPFVLYSQSDFKPGYIITNSNDTLNGLVEFKGYVSNSLSCTFKKSEKDSIIVFSPSDIQGYRFINEKYFVSRQVPVKDGIRNLFIEYIIKGKANVYYYRDFIGDHYLIDKDGGPLKEIKYFTEEVVDDGVRKVRESTIHIGLLKTYLSDCPEIFKEIEKLKMPTHENLTALAKNYHQYVCKDENCIIYEKKRFPVRIGLEPYLGAVRYNLDLEGNQELSKIFLKQGIFVYFWLPKSSEKLYLKTGFYSSKGGFIVFPLMFHYIFPGERFQPNISLGLSICKTYIYEAPFPSFGFGITTKLHKAVYLNSGVNLEIVPLFLSLRTDQKIDWATYSCDVGILVKF